MRFVGIDPGTRCLGSAIVNEQGHVDHVQVLHAADREMMLSKILGGILIYPRPIPGFIALIEDQEYRHGKAKGSPDALVPLAQIAGAAFSFFVSREGCYGCTFVTPMKWKGTVPKLQHHRRLLEDVLHWPYKERATKDPYCVPTPGKELAEVQGSAGIAATEWVEVLDAIGLALHARKMWLRTIDGQTSQLSKGPHA